MTLTLLHSFNALNATTRDPQSRRSVQPSSSGLEAAELSRDGIVIAWGGHALHTL